MKLFRGQAREGEGKEHDTLSYPGFILHPRLPNLQQLFLKRNHRQNKYYTQHFFSWLSGYCFIFDSPFLRIILYPARAPLLVRGVVNLSGFLLRNTDLHANIARLSKAFT